MSFDSATVRFCTRCGELLPPGTAAEGCPACLMKLATGGLISREPDERETEPELPRFDGFEMISRLGQGGMGVVFKARELQLNRVVALKKLSGGADSTPSMRQRFLNEARAAAKLRHHGIVAVYHVGEQDRQPFFSMEYVEGRTLSDVVLERPLKPYQAVAYMIQIAEAVQFAHENGVLHRDIKPSNILLDNYNQPRVTDFGLAKQLEDESNLTMSGEVMGTPGFMAPEQAAGNNRLVGPRSDVYSLGAVLFHLLTGASPFGPGPFAEVLTKVLTEEAPSPRTRNESVDRDLETICLKCLRKDPDDRYPTAAALAEDLRLYSRGEPIRARPDPLVKKLTRAARKHRRAVGVAAVMMMLVGASVGLFLQGVDKGLQQRAEKLKRVEDEFAAGRSTEAVAMLAAEVRSDPTDFGTAERLLSALTHRSFAVLAMPPIEQSAEITGLSASHSGDEVLIATAEGLVRRIELASAATKTEWRLPSAAKAVRFWQDGAVGVWVNDSTIWHAKETDPRILTMPMTIAGIEASEDERWLSVYGYFDVQVWDSKDLAKPVRTLTEPDGVRTAFVQGGQLVIATPTGKIRVYESPTAPNARVSEFPGEAKQVIHDPRTGRMAAIIGSDLWMRELSGTNPVRVATVGTVTSSVFSPEGSRVAICSETEPLMVHNYWRDEPSRAMTNSVGVSLPTFSPDGLFIAGAGRDGRVRLWSTLTGEQCLEPIAHPAGIAALEFGAGWVMSACRDRKVRVWDIRPRAARLPAMAKEEHLERVEFSEDGRVIVTSTIPSPLPTVSRWDFQNGEQLGRVLATNIADRAPETSHDGKWVLRADENWKRIEVLSTRDDQPRFAGGIVISNVFEQAAWSDDDQFVVGICDDKTVRLWSGVDGKPSGVDLMQPAQATFATVVRQGTRVLVGRADGSVQMYDRISGRPVSDSLKAASLIKLNGVSATKRIVQKDEFVEINSVALSADGRWLAAASLSGAAVFPLVQVNREAGEWLAELAERIAGLKVGPQGLSASENLDLTGLRERWKAVEADGELSSWLRWFLSDFDKRTVSPFGTMAEATAHVKMLSDADEEELLEVIGRNPRSQEARLRLAAKWGKQDNSYLQAYADFLNAYATIVKN